ncbi:hypothetical protein ACXPWS_08335 [Mycobacterium sp. BMJ-28]
MTTVGKARSLSLVTAGYVIAIAVARGLAGVGPQRRKGQRRAD